MDILSGKIAVFKVWIEHVFSNFILNINQLDCAECLIEFECKTDICNLKNYPLDLVWQSSI